MAEENDELVKKVQSYAESVLQELDDCYLRYVAKHRYDQDVNVLAHLIAFRCGLQVKINKVDLMMDVLLASGGNPDSVRFLTGTSPEAEEAAKQELDKIEQQLKRELNQLEELGEKQVKRVIEILDPIHNGAESVSLTARKVIHVLRNAELSS